MELLFVGLLDGCQGKRGSVERPERIRLSCLGACALSIENASDYVAARVQSRKVVVTRDTV